MARIGSDQNVIKEDLVAVSAVKNAWSYTSTVLYIFMTSCVIKLMDSFTFAFTLILIWQSYMLVNLSLCTVFNNSNSAGALVVSNRKVKKCFPLMLSCVLRRIYTSRAACVLKVTTLHCFSTIGTLFKCHRHFRSGRVCPLCFYDCIKMFSYHFFF